MFKDEELKSVDLLKDLTDEQIEVIKGLAQKKGDLVKEKYNSKEQELNTKINELTSKLENLETKDLKEKTKEPKSESESEGRNSELLAQIAEINKKLNAIESEKTNKSIKNQLLNSAKEKGYDLAHASELFDKLGDNLSDDFEGYEGLLKEAAKEVKEKSTPDPKEKNEPAKIEFETGDPLIDKILNKKGE